MKSTHFIKTRFIVRALTGGLLIVVLVPTWLDVKPSSLAQTLQEAMLSENEPAGADLYSYLGGASCSGSACHGSTIHRTKLKVGQNEFYIWSQKDRHSQAYEVLTGVDSKRIAKNLKIDKPEKSRRCLVCHAVQVDPARQGVLFDITEGVSCEACHGPAEQWLGPHIQKNWGPKRAAATGMYNTKDLVKRSEKCLSCHLGVGQDVVDHELIGAGHPRLKFEIDNYSHVMPAHWQPPKEKSAHDWLGTRAWAIGQAVALRNQIRLLVSSRTRPAGLWPDFVHFECYACHHQVVDHVRDISEDEKKMQRWRVRDYDGKPGRLVWNASSYVVFRHVVNHISPERGKTLDRLIKAFHDGLTGKSAASADFDSTLTKLSDLTEQLVPMISQHEFTQQNVLFLMRSISGDSRAISNGGFQSAEQAVLALASLYDAYSEAVGTIPERKRIFTEAIEAKPEEESIKDVMDTLFKDIEDGRTFSHPRFEADMEKLHGFFPRGSSPSAPS